MTRRTRLDRELVRRGLAETRAVAQVLIEEGRVTVDGAPALKPSGMVAAAQALRVSEGGERWASRGGHKLEGALQGLNVSPEGRHCLDAGASTGGFTDVLLRGGAERVIAVDVGYGQLRWGLRTDPRVVVLDRTNVRHLMSADFDPPAPSLVVADLSFISLRLVIPALIAVADEDADFILLVKPQFEVGRDGVGSGGVVRNASSWERAITSVVSTAEQGGRHLHGAVVSPLPGPSGNIEFFVHFRSDPPASAEHIDQLLQDGMSLRRSDRRGSERGQ